MRILFLTHLYMPSVGGVQRSVYNLAEGMKEAGHEVSVAFHAPRPPGFPVVNQRASYVGLNIPSPFNFHPGEILRCRLLDYLNLRTLRGWCRRQRIEIVHAHLINVDTRYAFAAAEVTGAKVVVTLRGGETEHWLHAHPKREAYIADVLRRADYVTAVSEALLDQAAELVPEVRAKSRALPNPLIPGSLKFAENPDAAARKPYLLFVGRLEDMKDLPTLIEAFHLLAEDGETELSLVIVGDGSRRSELETRAKRSGGRDRIHFLGSCSHERSLALIKEARLVVLPSQSSEGCPNVVMEAMALGVPVVVSDLPALVELVDQGKAGAVFTRGEPRDLAATLAGCLEDQARCDAFVAAGLERLRTRHDAASVIAAYEGIYEELVS